MLERMISDWATSAPLPSGLFSRLVRMTSTRSLGRMKPPAPVSGEISVEIARMPVGRIAAKEPEPLALTSSGARIGAPATNGARSREPASCVVEAERLIRQMRQEAVDGAGQLCQG